MSPSATSSEGTAPGGAYAGLAARWASVSAGVSDACAKAGRDPGSVRLMAVSKFHPVEALEAAYEAGARLFGENRVQEAGLKFPPFLALHPDCELHMIGGLQENKAKKAVRLFSCIQSVDSAKLLVELERRAAEVGGRVGILLEVHTGEESKAGFPDRDSLFHALETAASCGSLEPRGLMTMAPFTKDEALLRASFSALRSLFEEARSLFGFPRFDTLSMGMTNDYPIAIEEGSTMVRIGTAIFGARP